LNNKCILENCIITCAVGFLSFYRIEFVDIINCTIITNSYLGGIATVSVTYTGEFRNNIIYSSQTITSIAKGSSTDENCCFYPLTSSLENSIASSSISEDPQFIDAANDNFQLRPASLCKNIGVLI
jgi:hypothetical protein